MIKKCEICGAEFEVKRCDQKYCSSRCNQMSYKKRHHPSPVYVKKCEICGAEFETTFSSKIYCSRECHNKARSLRRFANIPLRKVKCPICGKEFETTNSRQIYCSAKCKNVQLYANVSNRRPTLLRKCDVCGAEFVPDKYHRLYCSEKCRDIGYQKFAYKPMQPVEKTCKHCGEKFMAETGQQKFCSEDCRKRYWLNQKAIRRQQKRYADLSGLSEQTEKPKGTKKREFRFSPKIKNRESEWSPANPKPVEPMSKLERFKLGNKDKQQLMALEASECGMSYGRYKLALEQGKTYEELKAAYEEEKALIEETNTNFIFR